MIEEATDIVCDTGPIIHLDELGCLDLLADFKEILLTVSVVEEIEKHRPVALREVVVTNLLPDNLFPLRAMGGCHDRLHETP
jgi:hypothetical protein